MNQQENRSNEQKMKEKPRVRDNNKIRNENFPGYGDKKLEGPDHPST